MDDDDVGGGGFFSRKSNYDMNSKIMLTSIISLSFVVVVVTFLHIYARYMLRRQARRQSAALVRLGYIRNATIIHTIDPPKTGLDPSVIAALPKFIFRQSASASAAAVECSVCLNALDDGEMARSLPNCKHTFHADCIDQWLESNSTCPICRMEVEPRLVAEPREGAVAPPSAPPVEGTSDGGAAAASAKIGSSSSRLSSFRRILTGERSSRRMPNQSCGQEEGLPDLERQ